MDISRIVLLIAVILLPFATMSSAAGPEPVAAVITKADNGKEISVNEGDVFEVRLEQSAGTGFSWEITGLDKVHLKVLKVVEAPVKKDEMLLGGPVLKNWKIKALKKGSTGLKILLYRSWEGVEKAENRFNVSIQIK